MEFESFISLESDTAAAAAELVSLAGGVQADLAVLFSSHHHEGEFETLLRELRGGVSVRNLIGCTGESIIGSDREIESQPAVALWMASLPHIRLMPFLIDQEDLQNLDSDQALIDRVGLDPADDPSFVVLADPFTFDVKAALGFLDSAYPEAAKVGGLASGADQPGQNRLFLNDQTLRQGLIGVALSGPIRIDTVVSQGCRPVGKTYVVTKAHANVLEELGGEDAYNALKQLFSESSEADRALLQRGVHVGVAIDEHLSDFRPGDFLVHNLMGVYQESKLMINSLIRTGQTIQFQVRDASTADIEMQMMLEKSRDELDSPAKGALLFSCNGRGRRMFPQPHHDIGLVNSTFPSCAVAGFFAAGEIGPVGGRTFVHGLTSSLILFREQRKR